MTQFKMVAESGVPSLQLLAQAPAELLDAIPAAIYVVDAEGRLLRFNARAVALWGRTPRTGQNGDRYCGSLRAYRSDGRSLPLSEAPMAEVLRSGAPVRDREVEIERPDGSRSVLLVNIDPLIDDRGELIGAINCFQDITERVLAGRELARSRRDIEDFFDNGAVGLHLVSSDGTILRANKAELQLLGYTADEYIGKPIRDFHADEEVITDILTCLSAGKQLDSYPARLRAKDGSIKHVLITSNVHFEDGVFRNTRCFTVDVTNWREAEARRADSERRLQATYEHAPVGIGETDPDGRFVDVNGTLERISGYPRDELLGMRFVELTHPEDRAEDAEYYRAQITEGLDSYAVEKRYVRKDGREIFVQVNSAAVRDEHGRFQYGIRIVQDITARREAQDRLAESERHANELLQALPVAIYTTDPEGRITFFNEAAVELSGRRPVIGSDSWCVTWRLYELDGTPLPHDACPMAVAIKEGIEMRGVVAVAERPDGTRIPFMPFPKLLRDSAGRVVGAINMLVDMTERRRVEEEQRALIDELNHRVKNTLATVQSLARQTMRSTPDGFLENFEARLMALSNAHNLLSSRCWTRVGLAEVLDRQLRVYAADGARVRFNGPDVDLSPRVGLILGMLVHELATNAAKHGALASAEGRVHLQWTLREEGDRRLLRLNWSETGGVAVTEPSRRGFGTLFLERSTVKDLRGRLDLRFAPAGVQCDIEFPLD